MSDNDKNTSLFYINVKKSFMVLATDAECSHKVMHIHKMIKSTTFFLSVFGLIEGSALLVNPFITRRSLGK
jgi:hypothetical protein